MVDTSCGFSLVECGNSPLVNYGVHCIKCFKWFSVACLDVLCGMVYTLVVVCGMVWWAMVSIVPHIKLSPLPAQSPCHLACAASAPKTFNNSSFFQYMEQSNFEPTQFSLLAFLISVQFPRGGIGGSFDRFLSKTKQSKIEISGED